MFKSKEEMKADNPNLPTHLMDEYDVLEKEFKAASTDPEKIELLFRWIAKIITGADPEK